jgi:toxin ParE1/3/4
MIGERPALDEMKRIRVSHPAEQDLDDIWYYIVRESGSIEIADSLVESITEMFPLFAQAPEAGTRRDEIAPGLRGFPVRNYIIYYAETAQHVVISRILHGMRDQKSAYRKKAE